MLANETFYSALIILIFIFSDATPQISIKVTAGIALMASIFFLVLSNIVYIVYNMIKGKEKLKESIKHHKVKRLEQEEQERLEEEERQRKKKEKEEEFSKIPDDTNNISHDANTTHHNNTTIAELKGKRRKGKGKGNDDVVEDHSVGPSDKSSSPEKHSDEKLKRPVS